MARKRPPTTSTARPAASRPQRADAERQRRQLLTILGAAVAAAVAVAVVLIVLNSREGDEVTGNTVDAGNGLRAPANEIDGGIARNGRLLGDPAAPVVVVEYADYQCPFCTGFGLTGLPQLLDDYVATGQVRLEYSHLS
jgi:protein-disulfide isomerase